jgi:hypothetical protein
MTEERADTVGHLGRQNVLELACLGFCAVQTEQIVKETKRQPVPADKLPGSFVPLGEELDSRFFDLDPPHPRKILQRVLTAIDLAGLDDLGPGMFSFLPERPNRLEDLVLFFNLWKYA